ncbi:hypothetical protein ACL6C3_05895 [Capilliphycus salinus ALCB114379]|uniref:hypothetical protein n=1 Tax=Capilliphycus salinus TaxID=2768948 RepID=UPI0039A5ECA8
MSVCFAQNVVLGFATNLVNERVEIFAKTLRQVYSPAECDLVIYTNQVDDQLGDLAEKYSIQFIYTPSQYSYRMGKVAKFFSRFLIQLGFVLARSTRNIALVENLFSGVYPLLIELWHHPHFVRWLCYQSFLKTHKSYQKVFLSDVKDVAFQSPFFESLGSDNIHFYDMGIFYGDPTYKEAQVDTDWYREAYGLKALKKVQGQPILNIGTVLGDFRGIELFVDLICEEILKRPFGRIEQVILNNLYYTSNAFSSVIAQAQQNVDSSVLTLISPVQEQITVTDKGILNPNRQLIPVVHMYNRYGLTMDFFSQVLGHEIARQGLVKNL